MSGGNTRDCMPGTVQVFTCCGSVDDSSSFQCFPILLFKKHPDSVDFKLHIIFKMSHHCEGDQEESCNSGRQYSLEDDKDIFTLNSYSNYMNICFY